MVFARHPGIMSSDTNLATDNEAVRLDLVEHEQQLPGWTSRDELAILLHEKMAPYNDTLEDVQRGLDYAFSNQPGRGGFAVLASRGQRLLGALVMLDTGMKGYIPENLLLMVVVDPEHRGLGIGQQIIDFALDRCEGSVKLHVEHDNPAQHLYRRLGFTSKYLEMRLERS
jgi:ribosomal protein S18 acetylase RimI-like enzyme